MVRNRSRIRRRSQIKAVCLSVEAISRVPSGLKANARGASAWSVVRWAIVRPVATSISRIWFAEWDRAIVAPSGEKTGTSHPTPSGLGMNGPRFQVPTSQK